MKVKLTDRFLRTHKPKRNEEIFDTGGCPGFGARIGPKGASFFLVYRRGTRKERARLGAYDPKGKNGFKLADARAEAEKIRGMKLNPAAERRRVREAGTFEKLAREFIAEKPRAKKKAKKKTEERELRPLTAVTYERQMENALIPEFGDLRLTEITEEHVEEFFENMAKKTPVHANRTFALLRRFFNWAIKSKKQPIANPCKDLDAPGGDEVPHEKDWTNDELRRVWKAIDGEEAAVERAFFQLAFLTCCRSGELRKAEWGWVDFDEKLLRVPAEANKAGPGHKKEVVLVRHGVEILEALRKLAPADQRYIFPGSGKEGHLATVQKLKGRISKRAKVDFRFHDIRDAVANFVGNLPGSTTDTVKRVLGHVIAHGATKSYLRVRNLPDQRRALEAWSAHLEKLSTGSASKVIRGNFPS